MARFILVFVGLLLSLWRAPLVEASVPDQDRWAALGRCGPSGVYGHVCDGQRQSAVFFHWLASLTPEGFDALEKMVRGRFHDRDKIETWTAAHTSHFDSQDLITAHKLCGGYGDVLPLFPYVRGDTAFLQVAERAWGTLRQNHHTSPPWREEASRQENRRALRQLQDMPLERARILADAGLEPGQLKMVLEAAFDMDMDRLPLLCAFLKELQPKSVYGAFASQCVLRGVRAMPLEKLLELSQKPMIPEMRLERLKEVKFLRPIRLFITVCPWYGQGESSRMRAFLREALPHEEGLEPLANTSLHHPYLEYEYRFNVHAREVTGEDLAVFQTLLDGCAAVEMSAIWDTFFFFQDFQMTAFAQRINAMELTPAQRHAAFKSEFGQSWIAWYEKKCFGENCAGALARFKELTLGKTREEAYEIARKITFESFGSSF
ncbi:MAG: hypothetical protein C0514_05365 [Candidatus Puniceispirillum sp.]|nr:hypothetical protein [Candidatus Puniceispirillum sp.]